jgi:hypothetical protein
VVDLSGPNLSEPSRQLLFYIFVIDVLSSAVGIYLYVAFIKFLAIAVSIFSSSYFLLLFMEILQRLLNSYVIPMLGFLGAAVVIPLSLLLLEDFLQLLL